ncbi:hypothetical protein C1645_823565 [Glomus cerebriforme]|uniref:Uncharacterized protein n=1 Tax=Glomus cerebriforme TaxID=658196 RepID=A0A397T2E3_9GLOM|nr:hypothetical protein C1645_823565 [Glomus cerebriforme]
MSATKTQLFRFGICFVGFATSILVVACFVMSNLHKFLLDISITSYAVLYTIGNILFFVSIRFLVLFEIETSDKEERKSFFSNVSWLVVVIYLTLAATLVIVFTLEDDNLCIILCIFQLMTLFWYCGGYILWDICKKANETYKKAKDAYKKAEEAYEKANELVV